MHKGLMKIGNQIEQRQSFGRQLSFGTVEFPNSPLGLEGEETIHTLHAPEPSTKLEETKQAEGDWLDVIGRLYRLPHRTPEEKEEIQLGRPANAIAPECSKLGAAHQWSKAYRSRKRMEHSSPGMQEAANGSCEAQSQGSGCGNCR
jgi:hypothetical protein